jgi:hypothetical protein
MPVNISCDRTIHPMAGAINGRNERLDVKSEGR